MRHRPGDRGSAAGRKRRGRPGPEHHLHHLGGRPRRYREGQRHRGIRPARGGNPFRPRLARRRRNRDPDLDFRPRGHLRHRPGYRRSPVRGKPRRESGWNRNLHHRRGGTRRKGDGLRHRRLPGAGRRDPCRTLRRHGRTARPVDLERGPRHHLCRTAQPGRSRTERLRRGGSLCIHHVHGNRFGPGRIHIRAGRGRRRKSTVHRRDRTRRRGRQGPRELSRPMDRQGPRQRRGRLPVLRHQRFRDRRNFDRGRHRRKSRRPGRYIRVEHGRSSRRGILRVRCDRRRRQSRIDGLQRGNGLNRPLQPRRIQAGRKRRLGRGFFRPRGFHRRGLRDGGSARQGDGRRDIHLQFRRRGLGRAGENRGRRYRSRGKLRQQHRHQRLHGRRRRAGLLERPGRGPPIQTRRLPMVRTRRTGPERRRTGFERRRTGPERRRTGPERRRTGPERRRTGPERRRTGFERRRTERRAWF